MIERIEVENVLDDIGISLALKGYNYLVDAVLIRDKNGELSVTTSLIYKEIARIHSDTVSRVERALRHLWQSHEPEIMSYFNLKCKMINTVLIEVVYREVMRNKKIQKSAEMLIIT